MARIFVHDVTYIDLVCLSGYISEDEVRITTKHIKSAVAEVLELFTIDVVQLVMSNKKTGTYFFNPVSSDFDMPGFVST